MIIYSKPGVTTHFSIQLPQIKADLWVPEEVVHQAKTIPTSTLPAGVFRHAVKYGVSAIERSFPVVVSGTQYQNLLALQMSNQTSFYVDTGLQCFDAIVMVRLNPLFGRKFQAQIDIRVNSQVR